MTGDDERPAAAPADEAGSLTAGDPLRRGAAAAAEATAGPAGGQAAAAALRQRAEAASREIAELSPDELKALSPEDTRRFLHELHVHQIELQMQNEELRRAQVELVVSRARYFDLYNLAPVGYCTLSKEGLILQANVCAATLLSPLLAAQAKQSISCFIHRDDGDTFNLLRQQLIATGEPQSCELRLVKKDGRQFWAHLATTLGTDGEGSPVIRLVLSDVSERKRAEHEILMRHLQETKKHESLGVLAGGIAHHFNNILAAILGCASLASRGLPPGSPQQAYLEQISESSLRAAELCKQMLVYAGQGRLVVERLDLGLLVEATAQLTKIAIGKQALLWFHLEKGLPLIEADATQLRSVVMSLVINASEAIGEKSGRITLTTGRTQVNHASRSGTSEPLELPAGDYICLEVADSGGGMSAETQALIFDPFFTTKFAGPGLGLAAALGIVRAHKGSITAVSEPGRGTTFKVWLPAMSGSGETPAPAPSADR